MKFFNEAVKRGAPLCYRSLTTSQNIVAVWNALVVALLVPQLHIWGSSSVPPNLVQQLVLPEYHYVDVLLLAGLCKQV